jgi:hypothetical protein
MFEKPPMDVILSQFSPDQILYYPPIQVLFPQVSLSSFSFTPQYNTTWIEGWFGRRVDFNVVSDGRILASAREQKPWSSSSQ